MPREILVSLSNTAARLRRQRKLLESKGIELKHNPYKNKRTASGNRKLKRFAILEKRVELSANPEIARIQKLVDAVLERSELNSFAYDCAKLEVHDTNKKIPQKELSFGEKLLFSLPNSGVLPSSDSEKLASKAVISLYADLNKAILTDLRNLRQVVEIAELINDRAVREQALEFVDNEINLRTYYYRKLLDFQRTRVVPIDKSL